MVAVEVEQWTKASALDGTGDVVVLNGMADSRIRSSGWGCTAPTPRTSSRTYRGVPISWLQVGCLRAVTSSLARPLSAALGIVDEVQDRLRLQTAA